MSEPERSAASTTTTPRARPEISRLRRGKWRAWGASPSRISEMIGALLGDGAIERFILRRIDRYPRRPPPPPPCRCSSAASCAAESMPRARPGHHHQPGFAQIARQHVRRICAPAPRRCGRRQSRPCPFAADGHGPARKSPAAADRAPQGRAEIPARRPRSAARPDFASAASSRAASLRRRQDEILAAAAPGQARQFFQRGARPCRSARSDWAKVTGPTFGRCGPAAARRSCSSAARVRAICVFALLDPMRGSSPRSSRRIFSRCMKKISAASRSGQRRIVRMAEQAKNKAATARWRSAPKARRCARSAPPAARSPPPASPTGQ